MTGREKVLTAGAGPSGWAGQPGRRVVHPAVLVNREAQG